MNESTRPLRYAMYGIYHALSSAMPSENAELANQALVEFLKQSDLEPEERHIYGVLVDSNEPDEVKQERRRLQLVINNG